MFVDRWGGVFVRVCLLTACWGGLSCAQLWGRSAGQRGPGGISTSPLRPPLDSPVTPLNRPGVRPLDPCGGLAPDRCAPGIASWATGAHRAVLAGWSLCCECTPLGWGDCNSRNLRRRFPPPALGRCRGAWELLSTREQSEGCEAAPTNNVHTKSSVWNPRRGALPQRDVTPAMRELRSRNLPLQYQSPLFGGLGALFSEKCPQRPPHHSPRKEMIP